VRADRAQLEQVVVNLAVNARDAMPQGGSLWVEAHQVEWPAPADGVPTSPVRQGVCLTVRDDGTGMDAPTSQRLFEPFFTTKPPGKGTGLGLTTVHRIVQEHDGLIEVESEPGEGTCFRVHLPLAVGDVEALQPSDYPRQTRRQARVLLVEDQSDVRKLSARILRQAGYDVVAVETGEHGLTMVRSSVAPFDVLVTDVVLPKMSGGELAVEAVKATPGLQVLYVSGYAEDDIVRRGVSTSQAAFLAKPFSPKALLHAVRRLLDARS
jgi:CheY-like chemotaxis protein